MNKNQWTEVLSLTLDPGVWILWSSASLSSDGNTQLESRFIGDGVIFGACSVPSFGTLGIADLSLALLPTVVKYEIWWQDGTFPPFATFVRCEPATAFTNTPGATFFIAVTDKSAEIDQILAAVTRTFPTA